MVMMSLVRQETWIWNIESWSGMSVILLECFCSALCGVVHRWPHSGLFHKVWLCIFWTAGISGGKVKEERLLLLWMRQWKGTYPCCKRLYGVVFVRGRCVREWGECRGQRLNRCEAGILSSAGFFQELILLYVVENLLSDYRVLKS